MCQEQTKLLDSVLSNQKEIMNFINTMKTNTEIGIPDTSEVDSFLPLETLFQFDVFEYKLQNEDEFKTALVFFTIELNKLLLKLNLISLFGHQFQGILYFLSLSAL